MPYDLSIIPVLAKKKGISIKELARRVGIQRQAIYDAMKRNSTKRETLLAIAGVLGVGIEVFELGHIHTNQMNDGDAEYRICQQCAENEKKILELEKRISDKEEVISSLRDQLKLYREKLGECEDLSKQA